MEIYLKLVNNLTQHDKENFSETIGLLNEIPEDLLNIEKSYFKKIENVSLPYCEINLVPTSNDVCPMNFLFEINNFSYKTIHWTTKDFNSVELIFFDELDEQAFKCLYDIIFHFLKASIDEYIYLVNSAPKKGEYILQENGRDNDWYTLKGGTIWFWNKVVIQKQSFLPWLK